MKVELPKDDATAKAKAPSPFRLLKMLGAAIGGFAALMLVFVMAQPESLLRAMAKVEARWGADIYGHDRSLAEKWSVLIGSYLRGSLDDMPPVPELVIDVPFKEMRQIYQKREQALAYGHLVQGDDDFVKASIRLDGETIPIRMRLKGDWTDHLLGRKWSYRIRTRDDAQVMGMRRFSIQNPSTRGFQAEPMYFALMQQFGVMTPRYEFVNVTINGEPVGLMALEEFFAKEMLEFNRRREGVIVRFDESLVWDSRDSLAHEVVGFSGAFDNYRNARVDSIGSSRIAASPALSAQFATASGMLTGFVHGDIAASDVFDAEQMGRFIAVSDAMGAWHAIRWMNMRFFLNPISQRLEPIAFDATLQKRFSDASSIINNEPMIAAVLADDAIWQVYVETLEQLNTMAKEGRLQAFLEQIEAQSFRMLQTEFRMLGNYPLDYIGPRVEALYERMRRATIEDTGNRFILAPHETRLYPKLAHVDLAADSDTLLVESAIPFEVEVLSATWFNELIGQRQPADIDGLPLKLSVRGIDAFGDRHELAINNRPQGEGWQLEATSRIVGRPWQNTAPVNVMHTARSESPIPETDLAGMRAAHDFLVIDEDAKRVRIPAGDWTIDEHLVIATGFGLDIDAGATLSFASDAALLVHGDVQWLGTESRPVALQPSGDTWPGLVVMRGGSRSTLEHVHIRDTSSVILPGWVLTGGINFYRSDVDIRSSRFSDSHGEDALNIIESEFTVVETEIRNTASDAFDSDFSNGSVAGGLFANIGHAGGGDAIDVSGSEILVNGVRFEQVYDKSLSVGERSKMMATNVIVDGTGTGAAAKDGSLLELDGADIIDASFVGMTAYIKKREYGPAQIIARNVNVRGTESVTLVQNGSRVNVDGEDAVTTDVDVDALYETIMRKGLQ